MTNANTGTENQTALDAKAKARKANKAMAYLRPAAQVGVLGAVPCTRLCKMFACISCGY